MKYRKIAEKSENPIDNLMIRISESLSPYFRKLGYTANGITTISLIFGLAAISYLYTKNLVPFAIYIMLANLFDNMDGYYARKYGLVSEQGDKYDHYKDWLICAGIIYVFYDKYNITDFPCAMIAAVLVVILGTMYVGCQEQLRDKKSRSGSLAIFEPLIPSKKQCANQIGLLRWFGPGSMCIGSILLAWYLLDQQTPGAMVEHTQSKYIDIMNPINQQIVYGF